MERRAQPPLGPHEPVDHPESEVLVGVLTDVATHPLPCATITALFQLATHIEKRPEPGRPVDDPLSETMTSVYERLHHTQLAMPAGEESAARRFYVDVLGMNEIDKPPVLAARGGAWFQAGAVELHLGVEDDFRPARKAHPGILVGDLDEIVRRLHADGQPAEWDSNFPGFRRIYAHDPFGNRLEFLEPSP